MDFHIPFNRPCLAGNQPPIIHHRILEYYPDLSLRELQEFHEAAEANCSSICTIAKVEI